MSTQDSFYWFDYETFGTHPAWDRPCQFAGVRTDMNLNEIEEPSVFFCRQSMDYLPNPIACQVTGLSPQQVNESGLCESEFIARIIEQIGAPGTCSLGYNNIRFDDEFTRHILFRNYRDAYEHEYKDGNSRWDLLDVVRLTRALRPDGINWPVNDEGRPSNRLEHLTAANGIEHGNAHDALSDVRATIGIARLIRQKQPRLFSYAFELRTKHAVAKSLNVRQANISLLVSTNIPATRSHLAAILPICLDPKRGNSVIVLDLQNDPTQWLDLSADEIARLTFNRGKSTNRPGLMTVQTNKCPVVMPYRALLDADAERLGIDKTRIEKHRQIAQRLHSDEMRSKIAQAMHREWESEDVEVEGSLYSGGFFSADDKQRAAALLNANPASIQGIGIHFEDERLKRLAPRFQARNYPESLSAAGLEKWKAFCHDRLTDDSSPWLSFSQFDEVMSSTSWNSVTDSLKEDLIAYRALVAEHAQADQRVPAVEET